MADAKEMIDAAAMDTLREAKALARYDALATTLQQCAEALKKQDAQRKQIIEMALRAQGARLALGEAFGFSEGEEDDSTMDAESDEDAEASGSGSEAEAE